MKHVLWSRKDCNEKNDNSVAKHAKRRDWLVVYLCNFCGSCLKKSKEIERQTCIQHTLFIPFLSRSFVRFVRLLVVCVCFVLHNWYEDKDVQNSCKFAPLGCCCFKKLKKKKEWNENKVGQIMANKQTSFFTSYLLQISSQTSSASDNHGCVNDNMLIRM